MPKKDANIELGPSLIYKTLSARLEEFLECIDEVKVPSDGGSGPLIHIFLANLIWGTSAELVYEVGMNVGTCSLRLLNALQYTGGKLHLFEIKEGLSPVYSKLAGMYPGQVEITWGNSNVTLANITDDRPEVIFVDGGHGLKTAAKDIELSLELVKPGGFIAVDDWDYPSVRNAAFQSIPEEQWFVHGCRPVGQVAYYQKSKRGIL